MTYFIVRDGAIHEAFESQEDASARAGEQAGARVIGDGWVTLSEAKDRVAQADRRSTRSQRCSIRRKCSRCDSAWSHSRR